MTNLEKILDRIREDAEARSLELMRETDGEIARLDEASEKETAQDAASIDDAARRDAQRIVTLARSSAASLRKKKVLEAKSRALDEAIEEALAQLSALPEEAYADLILTLVEKNTDSEPGTVHLAEGRPVADRAAFARRLAALPGRALTLSDETVKIDTGVMISYGKIEVDLSFASVLEEKKDAVRDRLNDLIFRDAVKE